MGFRNSQSGFRQTEFSKYKKKEVIKKSLLNKILGNILCMGAIAYEFKKIEARIVIFV